MDQLRYPSRAQWLRRLALRRRDKVAFVFSGGGPLGALQVGAVKALLESGVAPQLFSGSSVGALNAAFVAFNPSLEGVAELERGWRAMRDIDLFPGGRFRASWARMLVKGDRVFEQSGLARLIDLYLPGARIEEAPLPLAIVATDLETGDERVFTRGPLKDILLASAAMPGIFPPVRLDGRLYTDGGVSNNVPISPAVALGASTVYVMDSTSHSHQRRPLIRPMDYLLHAFSLARSQRLTLDLAHHADKVKIVVLPSVPVGFFVPFASLEHTQHLIDLAYAHTRRFLDEPPVRSRPVLGRVELVGPGE